MSLEAKSGWLSVAVTLLWAVAATRALLFSLANKSVSAMEAVSVFNECFLLPTVGVLLIFLAVRARHSRAQIDAMSNDERLQFLSGRAYVVGFWILFSGIFLAFSRDHSVDAAMGYVATSYVLALGAFVLMSTANAVQTFRLERQLAD